MKLQRFICSTIVILLALAKAGMVWGGEADDFFSAQTRTIEENSLIKKDLVHGSYPGEEINPATGQVGWTVTDLSVPGPAGMDIEINRKFQFKDGKKSYGTSYFSEWYDVNPFQPGPVETVRWQLDIPDIYTVLNISRDIDGNEIHHLGQMYCQQKYQAFSVYVPNAGDFSIVTRNANAALYPDDTELLFQNNWILSCETSTTGATRYDINNQPSTISTHFTLTAPNGRKYRFFGADYSRSQILDIFSTSHYSHAIHFKIAEIEDLNGNKIFYNYRHIIDESYRDAYIPTSITASDGRVVNINYAAKTVAEPRPTIDNITFGDTKVIYQREGQFLSRVILPNGDEWAYKYYGSGDSNGEMSLLKEVRVPSGALFTYTYKSAKATDICNFNNSCFSVLDRYGYSTKIYSKISIKDKTITGQGLLPYTETYDYDYKEWVGTTTIATPVRKTKYLYHRMNIPIKGSYDEDKAKLKNRLKETQILTLDDELISKTSYLHHIIKTTGNIYGSTKGYFPPPYPYQVVIEKTTTEQDGMTLSAQYSNFDEYGNPRHLTETGNDGTRSYTFEYFNHQDNWIIGVEKSKTLQGIGTISSTYDDKGRMRTKTEYGVVTEFEYYDTGIHDNGNLAKKSWMVDLGLPSPSKVSTTYHDYYRGQAQREVNPLNVTLLRKINDNGTLKWLKDGRGFKTEFTYDAVNRIESITPAIGDKTNIKWLTPNTQQVTRGKQKTVTQFDLLGRELSSSSYDMGVAAEKIIQRKSYDRAGRLNFQAKPRYSYDNEEGTTATFDVLDRVLTEFNSATNTTMEYCYGVDCVADITDILGVSNLTNVTVVTDPRGYKTVTSSRSYSNPNKKFSMNIYSQTENTSEGTVGKEKYIHTQFERDAEGKLKTVKQGGLERSYVYDSNNRLWKLTIPEVGLTEMKYDTPGNLVWQNTGNMGARTFVYDKLNQLKTADYTGTDSDVSIDYDNNGNISHMVSGGVVWNYAYNARDQLLSETLTVGSKSFQLSYGYNDVGYLTSITYPQQEQISYKPDALGRIKKVGEYAQNINYRANGMLQSFTYGNGVKYEMTLNEQQLPEVISSKKDYVNLVKNVYQYDDNNNVTKIEDKVWVGYDITMQYDGVNRLTAANGYWGAGNMSYDDLGNLLTKRLGSQSLVYEYDTISNRLEEVTGAGKIYDFEYDSHGNVTSNGTRNFVYNNADRLMSSGILSYLYDGNNKRTVTIKNGIASEYTMYSKMGKLMVKYDVEKNTMTYYYYLNNNLISKKVVELNQS